MGQVCIIELLTFQVVAVLARLQIAGLDATGLKELLVGNSKRLADSLSYDLGLDGDAKALFRLPFSNHIFIIATFHSVPFLPNKNHMKF